MKPEDLKGLNNEELIKLLKEIPEQMQTLNAKSVLIRGKLIVKDQVLDAYEVYNKETHLYNVIVTISLNKETREKTLEGIKLEEFHELLEGKIK